MDSVMVNVQGIVNRFGSQLVHDGLDMQVCHAWALVDRVFASLSKAVLVLSYAADCTC